MTEVEAGVQVPEGPAGSGTARGGEPEHPLVLSLPPVADAPEAAWVAWANDVLPVKALGLRCIAFGEHSAVFEWAQVPFPMNPNGAVNGGMVAAAADQMFGVLASRPAGRERLAVTGTLHAQYHRPAYLPLTVRGNLLPSGNRVVFVEVVVEDQAGRRCATCSGSMVLRRLPPEVMGDSDRSRSGSGH